MRKAALIVALLMVAAVVMGCKDSSDPGKTNQYTRKEEPENRTPKPPVETPNTFIFNGTVGSFEVKVTQFGKVEPGKETTFRAKLKGNLDSLKNIRMWVGIESAEGSIKAKAVPA